MKMEHLIMAAMWLCGIIGFILFIPLKDLRKGLLALMVFQAFFWLVDMFTFKFGWLSAPVRDFPKATDLPITINYFFYPALFSIYYVNKKGKDSVRSKYTYYFIWISGITLFDALIERYTDLLEYRLITWYGVWILIGILFFVSQVCCNWFFTNRASF